MSIKVISDERIRELLTTQLQALTAIDDDQVITKIKKVPEGWEIDTRKSRDD